jgi:hypothetical protein
VRIGGGSITPGRADPVEVAKAVAALICGVLLVAFLFHAIWGTPFGTVLLIGCFVLPPAVLAMFLALLIGRWIGMRAGMAGGLTLALSLPFGIVAGAGGLWFGFLVLTWSWDRLP